jgi:hypothetical protein
MQVAFNFHIFEKNEHKKTIIEEKLPNNILDFIQVFKVLPC